MRQAMSGIVVVELSDGVAGAYCGKVFADLGAEVWVLEPDDGHPLRHRSSSPPPSSGSRSGAFLHLATNKRSVRRRQVRLDELLSRAHLVIDATEESTLPPWDVIHARHPALSVVRISGFGASGPYAGYRWDDLVIEAMAGVLLRQDVPQQSAVRLPGELGSCFVGSMAALGALAAVLVAQSSAEGSNVDCAALEALASIPAKEATLLALQYRGGVPTVLRGVAGGATLIPTGVFPCADGYMAMMSTPQQLREMLDVLDDDALREAFARTDAFERGETKEILDAVLYPWLLSHTRAEATAEAQRVGWPLAGVNTPQEVLEADHLHQRGFWVHADDPEVGAIDLPGAPIRFGEAGWALRRLAPQLGQDEHDIGTDGPGGEKDLGVRSSGRHGGAGGRRPPLEGIRVMDLTTVWSGPYATMLLADLGAEVIRVENPWVLPPTTKGYTARPNFSTPGYLGSLYGSPAPGAPDRPWNRHAMNNSLARNKLSWAVDTRRAEGRELMLRLAEQSDVIIENFKASGLGRLGLTVDSLRERNPDLIAVRMPPTGLTGEWAGYTGFGAQFDGLTGLLWLCGEPDEDLTLNPATTYMDAASGPATALAVLAALRYRAATGRAQLVEFAQSENILNHLGDVFVDAQLGVEPVKWGNRHPWRAPSGLYPCRDGGRVAVVARDDAEWCRLAESLGRPELAREPRLATLAGRQTHHDELDAVISGWTAERTAYESFALLQAGGVTAGPVLDDVGFTQDPHVQARQWLQPLASADVGEHLHPGPPYRGVPQVWRRGAPVLGEDNEYVYRDILGLSVAEYERYRKEKILADDYLDPNGNPW